MASLPRAQYRLPLAIRSIIDLGDFYMFGGQLARRDMTPIGFDRANQAPVVNENHALSLKGAGGVIYRNATAFNFQDSYSSNPLRSVYAGAQFLFGMGAQGGVFTSQTGSTAGQKFVMHLDSICQVTDSGDLTVRSTAPSTGIIWRAAGQNLFIEHSQIIAENATTFFVYVRLGNSNWEASASTGAVYLNQRMRILNVDKTTWAWTLGNMWATQIISSITQNTANPTVATGGADAFMNNKGWRYLLTLSDGRMVFTCFGTCLQATQSASQTSMRYFIFDPATGSLSASRAYQSVTGARYVNGIPTGLLAGRAPSGVDAEGVYYLPDTVITDDTYTIRMFVLPKGLTANISANVIEANMAQCTITGLPAGLTLLAPAKVNDASVSKAQISSWLVKDGGEDFLVCYGHGNGILGLDAEANAPVGKHQMVIFKIDPTDPSKLIYVKHYSDAFGYGVVLSQLTGSADAKTIVVYNGSGFGILTWNSVTKSYTVSQFRGIPSGITRLHLDTSGQIWIEDIDCKVYVFNLDLSATVDVQYVGNPASLNYSGTTIEQEVDVTAFSFAGDRIVRTCRLVLKGATFDDGTVQKTITTSATAATRVKIYVNGSGNVNFDAFLQ